MKKVKLLILRGIKLPMTAIWDLDGDEVVQLYMECPFDAAFRSLKEFTCTLFEQGKKKRYVRFTLKPEDYSQPNADGKKVA